MFYTSNTIEIKGVCLKTWLFDFLLFQDILLIEELTDIYKQQIWSVLELFDIQVWLKLTKLTLNELKNLP